MCEKKKILFVDDEEQILKSLRRIFFKSEYNCFFASSGKEALIYLKEYDIDLIISDIRMPKMNGFQLLEKVKKHYPNVIKMALSGYSDRSDVITALEKNLAKVYLYKPWDNQELKEIIHSIFELEDSLNDKGLFDIFNNLDSLPTVPALYRKINEMLENNENIESITKEIERDQSLASKILRVANSAFYAAKTGSVKQAVLYIGLINVKNIVVNNAIFSSLNMEDATTLWHHAALTNKMSGYIYSKILLKKLPAEYSSAGLLHDIGRVVIMKYFDEYYEKINVLNNGNIVDIDRRLNYEKKLLGFNHEIIGGYLLNWWEIPLPIVETALYHHEPLNEKIINKEIVKVTYLSNILSWQLLEPDKEIDEINEAVIKSLDLDVDRFYQKMMPFLEEESERYREFLEAEESDKTQLY